MSAPCPLPPCTLSILNLPFASNCLETISVDPTAHHELGHREAELFSESTAQRNACVQEVELRALSEASQCIQCFVNTMDNLLFYCALINVS